MPAHRQACRRVGSSNIQIQHLNVRLKNVGIYCKIRPLIARKDNNQYTVKTSVKILTLKLTPLDDTF